jgi:hypothetical protein
VKYILLLVCAVSGAPGQTTLASIAGNVSDVTAHKPVPAALITAVRSGAPPFARSTKSGGDGAFQVQGLTAGKYSLCVQAPGEGYLDPCQWNGSAAVVTLASGQAVSGISLRLTAASILSIQVKDANKVLSKATKDGRRPDLTLGVWGPNGLFYPAHASGGAGAAGEMGTISYRIEIPRDKALKFHIASRDVRLGDESGAALPGNASQQAFQHATGDPNPKNFSFTVLGLLP